MATAQHKGMQAQLVCDYIAYENKWKRAPVVTFNVNQSQCQEPRGFDLTFSFFFFLVQNVLTQIPKLKHVIYVDQKKASTGGYPDGLSIHSMQAVEELGQRSENSA